MASCITQGREYLTPKQLAARLQVTPATARRWAANNVIPAVKVGGVVRFDAARVQEALESQSR